MNTEQVLLTMIVALAAAVIWIWRLRKERDYYVDKIDAIHRHNDDLQKQFRFDHTLCNLEELVEAERSRLADLKEASTHLKNQIFIDMIKETGQTVIYRGPR